VLGDDREVDRVLRVPVERLHVGEVREQHDIAVAVRQTGVLRNHQGEHPVDVLPQPAQRLHARCPARRIRGVGPGEDHDMTDHALHPARGADVRTGDLAPRCG